MSSASCTSCGISDVSRRCELCAQQSAQYCCAEHQLGDWLARHKDECTYIKAGLGACAAWIGCYALARA
jgi:hypothetical protein